MCTPDLCFPLAQRIKLQMKHSGRMGPGRFCMKLSTKLGEVHIMMEPVQVQLLFFFVFFKLLFSAEGSEPLCKPLKRLKVTLFPPAYSLLFKATAQKKKRRFFFFPLPTNHCGITVSDRESFVSSTHVYKDSAHREAFCTVSV